MKNPITRRKLVATFSILTAGLLSACKKETYLLPKIGSLTNVSDALNMATQRLLLKNKPLAPEYETKDISSFFPTIGTTFPVDDEYRKNLADNFEYWRLPIEGLVSTSLSLSLPDIQALPSRTQITAHSCERGWTAIAQWTGVPLSHILEQAGILPEARYVVIETSDNQYDSLDMFDAFHPQTILAYKMNGKELPVRHGAPLRLRAELHLGYKQRKYIKRIVLVDSMKDIGKGYGSFVADTGLASWNAGI